MDRVWIATVLIVATGLGCYIVPAQPARTPASPPQDPAPEGPQNQAPRDFRIAQVVEYGQRVEGRFAGALGTAVGYVIVAGQGAQLVGRLQTEPAGEIVLYGPLATTWEQAPVSARGVGGDLNPEIPVGGTYLLGVFGPVGDQSPFEFEVQCEGDECRHQCGQDHSCPAGAECQVVHCVREPCPSYCGAVAP